MFIFNLKMDKDNYLALTSLRIPLNVNYDHFLILAIFFFSYFLGSMKIGLTSQCLTIFGRDQVCLAPNLSPEWVATLIFIVGGILCLTVTCVLLLFSHRKAIILEYARWIAFSASKSRVQLACCVKSV